MQSPKCPGSTHLPVAPDPGPLCERVPLCVSHAWVWVWALWNPLRALMMDVLTHRALTLLPAALRSYAEGGWPEDCSPLYPPPKLKASPPSGCSLTPTGGGWGAASTWRSHPQSRGPPSCAERDPKPLSHYGICPRAGSGITYNTLSS